MQLLIVNILYFILTVADNFLEKQYADYQSRKSAMKVGTQRKVRQAMWQIVAIALPSIDNVAMQHFYVNLFGGELAADGSVEFDNGLRLRFQSDIGAPTEFVIRMASNYQYEQLMNRLSAMGIVIEDGTIFDPSNNKIAIII